MNFVQRRRFLWILFLAALALLGLFEAVANSTTLARMRFEELARQATAVARLRCLSAEGFLENGEVWTDTRFEVVEQSKGLLPGLVTVRTIGGVLGSLHSRVEGVPGFRPGEEAYLFLWGREGEPYRVLGWLQGTFRIARDARGSGNGNAGFGGGPDFLPANAAVPTRGGIRNMPVAVFQLKLRKALEEKVL